MPPADPGGGFRLLRSLTFRLAPIYVAILAVSVAALIAILFWASVYVPLRQVESGLEQEVAMLLAGTPSNQEMVARLELRAATPAERHPPDAGRRRRRGPRGQSAARAGAPVPRRLAALRVRGLRGRRRRRIRGARDIALPDGGRLLLGRGTEDLDEHEELLGQAIGWGTGVTLLTGLLGALLMTRAVGRRIEGVRRTAEQVMTGDLSRRVALTGSGDDFDRLAETLNAMLGHTEALMKSVRRVSDSVAHELSAADASARRSRGARPGRALGRFGAARARRAGAGRRAWGLGDSAPAGPGGCSARGSCISSAVGRDLVKWFASRHGAWMIDRGERHSRRPKAR